MLLGPLEIWVSVFKFDSTSEVRSGRVGSQGLIYKLNSAFNLMPVQTSNTHNEPPLPQTAL